MAAPGEGRGGPPLQGTVEGLWPPLMRVELEHPLQGTVEGAVAAPGESRVEPPSLEGTVEGAVAAPGEGRVCPVWESVQVKHERSVGVDRYHVDR